LLHRAHCLVGGLCGSVYLDAGFERHVSFLVGDEAYAKLDPRRKNQMLEEFEFGIKRCFDDEETDTPLWSTYEGLKMTKRKVSSMRQ
jgi:hypothetical protein